VHEIPKRLALPREPVRLGERGDRLRRGHAPIKLFPELDRAIGAAHVLRPKLLIVKAVDERKDGIRLVAAARERHAEMRPAERRRQKDERARGDDAFRQSGHLLTSHVRPPRRLRERRVDVASAEASHEEPGVHLEGRQAGVHRGVVNWKKHDARARGIDFVRERREVGALRRRQRPRLEGRVVPREGTVGLERPDGIDENADSEEHAEDERGHRLRAENREARQKRDERHEKPRAPARGAVPGPPGRGRDEHEEREPRERKRERAPLAGEPHDTGHGEKREREIQEEPFVRAHGEAPEPVEHGMAEALARIGRERAPEAHDLENEPERRGSQPAGACGERASRAGGALRAEPEHGEYAREKHDEDRLGEKREPGGGSGERREGGRPARGDALLRGEGRARERAADARRLKRFGPVGPRVGPQGRRDRGGEARAARSCRSRAHGPRKQARGAGCEEDEQNLPEDEKRL
jgi:hypothetical protein